MRKLLILSLAILPACQSHSDSHTCELRQPDADHAEDDAYFHLADMDYIPLGSVGVWITAEGTNPIWGYSTYEDSNIYRTRSCALSSPEYISD